MAKRTGFTWSEKPSETIVQGMIEYVGFIRSELDDLVNELAPKIENWMKANAIWNDRTTDARKGLKAELERDLNEINIILHYSVDYGHYLEYAFAGKYSILGPALDYWSPILWQRVSEIMRR